MIPRLPVLATLLLLTTLMSLPVDGQRRIRNGNQAREHSVPSIASLQDNGEHFCGGSLIAPTWIVTAAHCVDDKTRVSERYKAVLGEHNLNTDSGNEQTMGWKRVIVHPEWRGIRGNGQHDIALIELQGPLDLNQYVKLASVSRDPDDNLNREDCLIVGWGRTDANGPWATRILQQAQIETVPTDQCDWKRYMISGQVCVKDMNPGPGGHSSACNRDSGGPLMCGEDFKTLKGATSYGAPGCDGRVPQVYTKLSGYIDWIEQHTGPLQECKENPLDISIYLDSSYSVDKEFSKQKQFVINLAKHVTIGPTRVAWMSFGRLRDTLSKRRRNTVLKYSYLGGHGTSLKKSLNKEAFFKDLRSMEPWGKRQESKSSTGSLLGAILSSVSYKNDFSPSRGGRPEVPDVFILITDGRAKDPEWTKLQASELHKTNIKTFVVMVGDNCDREMIDTIASDPVNNVIDIDSPDAVDKFLKSSGAKTC